MRLIPINLGPWFNNVGTTTDEYRLRGNFDGCGGSYPFDDLRHLVGRPVGLSADCNGSGSPDNVACEGQVLSLLQVAPIERVVVVGSAEGSLQEPLTIVAADGRRAQLLFGLTDFLAGGPAFGERCLAIGSHLHRFGEDVLGPRPRLWCAELAIPDFIRPDRLVLPKNPLFHLFSITLVTAIENR
jgi:hypothetical protein